MLEVSSSPGRWLAAIMIMIRLIPWLMQSIDSLNDLTRRPIPEASSR
jgi:hypothetical protein